MEILEQLRSGALQGSKRFAYSGGLTEFPEDLFQLTDSLEILDLSGNNLSSLPARFAEFRRLKILFLSFNRFTELPAVISRCSSLSMLGMRTNAIQHIGEDSLPRGLRWLILTDNQIHSLPRSLSTLQNLQKLMLAGNRIEQLPDEMQHCRSLELVRLSANHLSDIPEWLLQLPRLAWLALAGNPATVCTNRRPAENLVNYRWSDLSFKEVLGEGASGITWRASLRTGSVTEREVAVKLFKGEMTSDGLCDDEIRACQQIGTHSGLIEVLGTISDRPEGGKGLVFSLLPRSSVSLGAPPDFDTCTRDTFPAGRSFRLEQAASLFRQISEVAAHLHAQGVMHGDLYAHNILLDTGDRALLSDFGGATIFDPADQEHADKLQRIDVRAFGYLMQDILDRIDIREAEKYQDCVARLRHIEGKCLNPHAGARPAFTEITIQLKSLVV